MNRLPRVLQKEIFEFTRGDRKHCHDEFKAVVEELEDIVIKREAHRQQSRDQGWKTNWNRRPLICWVGFKGRCREHNDHIHHPEMLYGEVIDTEHGSISKTVDIINSDLEWREENLNDPRYHVEDVSSLFDKSRHKYFIKPKRGYKYLISALDILMD